MDVLDLYAKISLDKTEYDKGLDDASDRSHNVASKIGGGLAKAAKVGAAAIGAAAGVVATFTKQAVDNFADYEQLVGGVETLFGDAAGIVQEKAAAAFKTAGLSANEYMETVTSFSASLLQSLGGDTDKAAQIADQAIIDMSDNANKMGSSMESIQNAYQGFAKQNYTMLDNLKLGYGGTKEEMQRLLDDAGKLAGTTFELGNYADVIEAIHVVQENMGIAGTTAKEAATTISGSMSMMKSAWQNTLTAIGEGDMSKISDSIGQLVESAKTFAGNIMPVIQRALEGVSQLIAQLAPEIAAALPELISTVLPSLLDAGVQIIQTLGEGILGAIPVLMPTITDVIMQLVTMLVENLPLLIDTGMQVIIQLAQGIAAALPELIPTITDAVLTIVDNLIENAPLLLDAGLQLIMGLAEGFIQALPQLIERLPEIIQSIVDFIVQSIPLLIDAAIQLVTGIAEALPTIIQAIVDALPTIIDSIIQGLLTALPQLIEGLVRLNLAIVEALPQIIQALIEAIPQIITTLVDAIVENAPLFVEAFVTMFASVGEMILSSGSQWVANIGQTMSSIIDTAVQWLEQLPERFAFFAGEMVGRFIMMLMTLPTKIQENFSKIVSALQTFGTKFITEGPKIAREFATKLVEGLKELPAKMLEIGKNIVEGIKKGIQNAWANFKEWMKGLVGEFIEGLKGSLKIGSPSKVMADEVGRWIPAGIAMGIDENAGVLYNAINGLTAGIVPSITPLSDAITSNMTSYTASPVEAQPINVYVTLEGDADRLFRVVETKATSNYRLTGRNTLVTV